MQSIHSRWKKVPESDIGLLSHVEYQHYIRWMREMAQDHFAMVGLSTEYFTELGKCFVVRRHSVEHLSPCFLDDRILMVSWVSELGSKTLKRQHRIIKLAPSDEKIKVVSAESLSIFVDDQVKPALIPDAVRERIPAVGYAEVVQYMEALDEPVSGSEIKPH